MSIFFCVFQNYETFVTPVVGYLGEVNLNLIDYNKDEVGGFFLQCVW